MTERLRERLGELHKLTAQTPLFNPVFQMGLDLSRELERGDIALSDVAAMVEELGCEALQSRAHRLADHRPGRGERGGWGFCRLCRPVEPAAAAYRLYRAPDLPADRGGGRCGGAGGEPG